MKVYCLSGLGADFRAFSRLDFGHELVPVNWLEPYKNESLYSYTDRLSNQISTNHPFAVLGLSFGGVIAQILNQKINPQYTFLISSFLSSKELPLWAQISSKLRLGQMIPKSAFNIKPPFFDYMFGIRSKEDKALIHSIIKNSDPNFVKWAINAVFQWKGGTFTNNVVRIHGKSDKVIPFPYDGKTHKIEGGHFCIYTHFQDINFILSNSFKKSRDYQ